MKFKKTLAIIISGTSMAAIAEETALDKAAKTMGSAIGAVSNAFARQALKNTSFNKNGQFNGPPEPIEPLYQPVKKCIKPNNVIDQEVLDCMKNKP